MDNSLPPGPSNKLYQLRMTGDVWQWTAPLLTSELPDARWRHSAAVWDKTKIVIFGGYMSSSCRHSDTWIFNSVTLSWTRPVEPGCVFDADGNHMPVTSADPNTPSPRGSHTANVIGDVMYIFGGFGGSGFSRRDFNDLHSLNLETLKWATLHAKGRPPEVGAALAPRSVLGVRE